MSMRIFSFLLVIGSVLQAQLLRAQQVSEISKVELENFAVGTNQDFYLAGDRLWFSLRLMKNHSSYFFSKLAHLEVYDSENKLVHQEKILLDQGKQAYGDIILPENRKTGVYSMLVYSKWMMGFEGFPIAKKQFFVYNPGMGIEDYEPDLFLEVPPFPTANLGLFHNSDKSEPVEVLDMEGNTVTLIEALPGMKIYPSQINLDAPIQLVFRNKTFNVHPSPYQWDPVGFGLEKSDDSQGWAKLVSHTDWKILEEIDTDGASRIALDKSLYGALDKFSMTVLDREGKAIWTYEYKVPKAPLGTMVVSSEVELGKRVSVDLSSFPHQTESGFFWVKNPDPESLKDFAEVLHNPNWFPAGNPELSTNLPAALSSKPSGGGSLEREFLPMAPYKEWTYRISDANPLLLPQSSRGFPIPQDYAETELNRKLFHQYFGQAEDVSGLSSPFTPDIVYRIRDYVSFEDIESFMKEIVIQTRIRKNKTTREREFRILDVTDGKPNFNRKPLILVDFHRINSMDELLKIELNQLDRVEVYYNRNTIDQTNLGEMVGNGLLAFFTKNNDFSLKNNIPSERYFLKDLKVSRKFPDQSLNEADRTKKYEVNLLKPQFFDPLLKFNRGRARVQIPYLDYPGELLLETWVFENDNYSVLRRTIKVD